MTGPHDRQVGLGQALAEFEELLAKWHKPEMIASDGCTSREVDQWTVQQ